MIERLTSSKEVIAKVIADLNLKDEDLRIPDMIVWVGEALEKIGGVHQYATQITGETNDAIIEIEGYQAPLPCDIHRLISVAYSRNCDSGWVPTRVSTNTFNKWGNNHKHKPTQHDNRIDMFGTWPMTQYANKDLRGCTDYTTDVTYSLKPGWINFNVRDGFCKLAYTVIPTDDYGYPLVPQIASVMEAVASYISMKLMYSKYISGDLPQYIYNDMKEQWHRWSNVAYGQMIMPNIDEWTSIKHNWITLYPNQREEQTFYDTIGGTANMYDPSKRIGGYPWNRRTAYGYGY